MELSNAVCNFVPCTSLHPSFEGFHFPCARAKSGLACLVSLSLVLSLLSSTYSVARVVLKGDFFDSPSLVDGGDGWMGSQSAVPKLPNALSVFFFCPSPFPSQLA